MKARSIVQITVVAVVLTALFGVFDNPVQAQTLSAPLLKAMAKRTTIVDPLTLSASRRAVIQAGGGSETFIFRIPPPVDRSDPSAKFDWLIRFTLVVIVVSAGIGAVGSLLTRAAPSGAGKS